MGRIEGHSVALGNLSLLSEMGIDIGRALQNGGTYAVWTE